MADTNQIRRAEFDFADNDPFAELTRIMGHDPRVPAQPAQPAVVTSLDDQLDRELARELDFGEFDEPGEVDTAAHPDAPPADPYPDDAQAYEAEAPVEQVETAEVYDGPEASREADHAAGPEAWSDDHVAPQEADLAIEAGFAEAFELEMEAHEDALPVHAAEPAEDVLPVADALPEPVEPAMEEPVAPVAAYAPMADAVSEMEQVAAGYAEPVFAPSEPEPAMEDAVAEPEAAVQAALPEEAFEEAPPAKAWAPEHDDVEALSPDAETAWQEQAQEPEQPRELSLEEELSALLSVSAPAAAIARQQVAPSAPPPANDAWRPSVQTFGRANFASAQPGAAMPPAAAEPVAQAPVAEPVYEAEPEVVAPEPVAPEAVAFAAEDEPVAARLEDAQFASVGEVTYDAGSDHLDDLLGELEIDVGAVEAPYAYGEPSAEAAAPLANQPYQYDAAATVVEYAPDDDTPAVETVDVSEGPVAVADDLDIPEVDYGTPAPPIYDELENEFQRAFGEMSVEEPVTTQAAAGAEPSRWEPENPQAYDDAPYADGVPAEGQWQQQPYSEDYDYETDLRQAIAMSAYEEDEQEQQAPRKRGLIVAAFVAAVAVIGGAGVFGMSIFGEGSDGPALVLADSDPMKVRPENPGGTTVPNQNNEVYQRVGGGTSSAGAPAQERLVTTAEEPVDIAAEDEDVLPGGITGELDGEALADEPFDAETDLAGLMPKSEERIEQAEEPNASGELAAVAPRRVRTMVVRPDGTMVAREDPAPVPLEEPQDMPVASAPTAAVPALGPASTGTVPAAEDDEGPRVVTPERVAVVPAPRGGQQPAAAQQPARQQPAATPVAAPANAAAAGQGWSMQIASQPSAEGAQSTYQDLARRYGNVLQGRGVNIVRANIEGKGVYYRVRIPASSREEAIQLCTRYKSAGGSCFVSR